MYMKKILLFSALGISSLTAANHNHLNEETPNYALLAPAQPCSASFKEKGAPYITASGLLWQSKLGGLEFTEKSFNPADPNNTDISFKEKIFTPDFSWNPGFKVCLGQTLPYDGWDLKTQWTYYHGNLTNLKRDFESVIQPTGIGIVPLWYSPLISSFSSNTPMVYEKARADWTLNLNSLDLDMGRFFFISKSLLIRLATGLKGALSHQRYVVHYHNSTGILGNLGSGLSNGSELLILDSKFSYQQKTWYVGPRSSIDSKWPLSYGFSLIASGAFSLMYSHYNTTTQFQENTIANSSITLKRKERFHLLTPVIEAQLGFDWGICFNKKEDWGANLTIAYECQYWWSQNHARRNYSSYIPQGIDSRGDLQMQGLTATVRVNF